ncbi:HU family DNA-binding protein [Sphingomonas sp. Root710]|uniref:HU family DNA-binding protein n=1 Tax=Sphingomonas sp. Root710 TaxID=1736594 RepID=UPI0039E1FD43
MTPLLQHRARGHNAGRHCRNAGRAVKRHRIWVGDEGMNKQELIGTVAETTGMTKNDASKAVEAVFDSITGQLKKGDEVRLVGFGTFSVSKRKASTGRNPRTGEPMKIAASSQPKFKPGKGLKDAVN